MLQQPSTARATPAYSMTSFAARKPLTAFFVLAFAFTWLAVLPLSLSRNWGAAVLPYELPEPLAVALYVLASFVGPTVAALVVTGLSEGKRGMLQLLRRCVQWRVRPVWYIVVLTINLVIWLLAYSAILGPALLLAAVTHWPLLFSTFLPMVAFGLLIPAIGEEPGWRGFALPRMQQRYGPLRASLLLGALHGVWHFPALLTVLLGPFTAEQLLPFVATAVATTFIYTWVYNHTGGSVLLAMLLHASGNAASVWLGALLEQAAIHEPQQGVGAVLIRSGWLNLLAYGLVALLIAVRSRGRLGYRAGGATADLRPV